MKRSVIVKACKNGDCGKCAPCKVHAEEKLRRSEPVRLRLTREDVYGRRGAAFSGKFAGGED